MGTANIPKPELPAPVRAPVKVTKDKTFNYKLVIKNNKQTFVQNLGFRMELPAGVSFVSSSLAPKHVTRGAAGPTATGQ
jgi:hypothetical protein